MGNRLFQRGQPFSGLFKFGPARDGFTMNLAFVGKILTPGDFIEKS
jgi:hypothetical protein